MIKWLTKKFVKNPEDVHSPEVRQGYGTMSGAVGIFLNLCLFAGKLVSGLLSGSIAITADALNNLGRGLFDCNADRLPDGRAEARFGAPLRPWAD